MAVVCDSLEPLFSMNVVYLLPIVVAGRVDTSAKERTTIIGPFLTKFYALECKRGPNFGFSLFQRRLHQQSNIFSRLLLQYCIHLRLNRPFKVRSSLIVVYLASKLPWWRWSSATRFLRRANNARKVAVNRTVWWPWLEFQHARRLAHKFYAKKLGNARHGISMRTPPLENLRQSLALCTMKAKALSQIFQWGCSRDESIYFKLSTFCIKLMCDLFEAFFRELQNDFKCRLKKTQNLAEVRRRN